MQSVQLTHWTNRGVVGTLDENMVFHAKGTKKPHRLTEQCFYYEESNGKYPLPIVPYTNLGPYFIFYNTVSRGLVLTISVNRIIYVSVVKSSNLPGDTQICKRIESLDALKADKCWNLFSSSVCHLTAKENGEDETKESNIVSYQLPLLDFLSPGVQEILDLYLLMKKNKVDFKLSPKALVNIGKRRVS